MSARSPCVLDVPCPPPTPLEEAGHPPQGGRGWAVGFGPVRPLPKSSGDSSIGAATVKDGWGWHQAGLGRGRTSPAPGWLSVNPPRISRAQ